MPDERLPPVQVFGGEQEGRMTSDFASTSTGKTEPERIAHSRKQAAQFLQWAVDETVLETRDGLLDMAQQYERLAGELEARATARDPQGNAPIG